MGWGGRGFEACRKEEEEIGANVVVEGFNGDSWQMGGGGG